MHAAAFVPHPVQSLFQGCVMITLDIFSDPVCPWCMIGKANLDRALERFGDHPFRVEWHPYQLNPAMPREGVDHAEFLEKVFTSQMQAAKALVAARDAAERAGIVINFEKIKRQPNTLDAHRLIHWAGLEGRQNAVVSALFKAHFQEGRDIGNPKVLSAIAGACGMDADMVARLLATDSDANDLFARDLDARHKGVSAVPTFLIAREYVVSGAQSVAWWIDLMNELVEKLGEVDDQPEDAEIISQTPPRHDS